LHLLQLLQHLQNQPQLQVLHQKLKLLPLLQHLLPQSLEPLLQPLQQRLLSQLQLLQQPLLALPPQHQLLQLVQSKRNQRRSIIIITRSITTIIKSIIMNPIAQVKVKAKMNLKRNIIIRKQRNQRRKSQLNLTKKLILKQQKLQKEILKLIKLLPLRNQNHQFHQTLLKS